MNYLNIFWKSVQSYPAVQSNPTLPVLKDSLDSPIDFIIVLKDSFDSPIDFIISMDSPQGKLNVQSFIKFI